MKSKTKLSTAILIGFVFLFSTNCFSQIKKDSIELERRIKELFEKENSVDIYACVGEIEHFDYNDYSCPICGRKVNDINNDSFISGMGSVGKIVQEIKQMGYDVCLDVNNFCEKCSGKSIYNPELKFMIRFSSDSKYKYSYSNDLISYNCLLEFLRGKESFKVKCGEKLIADNIDEIYRMTGLGKEYSNQGREQQKIIKRDSLELERRLKYIYRTPYTGNFYSLLWGRNYSDEYDYYKCPTCGKETRRSAISLEELRMIEIIFNRIKDAGYDVALEQREYCKYCSKRIFIKDASLFFKIRFSPNTEYHIVSTNNFYEYDCLFQFLLYRKKFWSENTELPICLNVDIIQKMTGLGSDLIIPIKPKKKKKWYEK